MLPTERLRSVTSFLDQFGEEAALLVRFWSKVDRSGGENACWLWTGKTKKRGYGTFTTGVGKSVLAHRLAYQLANMVTLGKHGPQVCHDCPDGDNPRCCNPRHLFVGTAKDNFHDAIHKGTARPFGKKLDWSKRPKPMRKKFGTPNEDKT